MGAVQEERSDANRPEPSEKTRRPGRGSMFVTFVPFKHTKSTMSISISLYLKFPSLLLVWSKVVVLLVRSGLRTTHSHRGHQERRSDPLEV